MSRRPPPAPHPHATNLPQYHPHQAHHSLGETDISYSTYSPSPSSLSVHRYKWGRIRDWRSHNAAPVPRHLGSMGSHGPSVGVGSANWSDTGTGLDEGQTDIGTIPTTVRLDRELRDSTIIPNKRDRVDPKRHIGSQQSSRHNIVSRIDHDPIPSELPYRQNSERRSNPPNAVDQALSRGQDGPKTSRQGGTHPTALARQLPRPNGIARPALAHSNSRSKPTPQLAKPPVFAAAQNKTQVLPAGSPLVTSPESDKRHQGKNSPFAMREAYLNSVLVLPLDMLSQTQKEDLHNEANRTVKPSKSQASINSEITTGRLASLMGNSRRASPNGATKRIVSEGLAVKASPASKAQETAMVKDTKKAKGAEQAISAPRAENGKPSEMLASNLGQVRQMGSHTSSRTAKPQQANPKDAPRALGSTGATQLSRSATAPAKPNPLNVHPSPIHIPKPQEVSALGLDLGVPAPSIKIARSSDPPAQHPVPSPAPPLMAAPLQPAPHRQLMALRRPALTPGNSTDNLANTLAAGRRSRDPSTTDLLKTRFEPATYPLPESQSDATMSGGEGMLPKITKVKPGKETKEADPAGDAHSAIAPPVDATSGKRKKGKGKGQVAGGPTPGQSALVDSIAANKDPTAWPIGPVANPVLSVLDLSGGGLPSPAPEQVPKASMPAPSNRTPPATPYIPIRRDTGESLSPPPLTPEILHSRHPQSPDSTLLSPPHNGPIQYHRPSATPPTGSRLGDDDRVSFEVPNGARGRLRVSLAWFRDRARTHQDRTSQQQSLLGSPPPPVPPKPFGKRFVGQVNSSPSQEPAGGPPAHLSRRQTPPGRVYPDHPARPSPERSPMELDGRTYGPYDPFRTHATLPAYNRAKPAPPLPSMQPFQVAQMGHPFAYPQPQPPHPAWASHPQLAVPPHVQFQFPPQLQSQGSRRAPPSMESIDPPSVGNTPPMPQIGLPGMGLGPMGMQSGIMNPYAHGMGLGQGTMGLPQTPSRMDYGLNGGRQGDYGRPSIWKRMFNSRPGYQSDNNNDHDYDMGDGGLYGTGIGNRPQRGGGFGNDKVGRWKRGIIPGRAPSAGVPGTTAGYGDQMDYNRSQPFYKRGFSFNRNGTGNANGNGYMTGESNPYAVGVQRLGQSSNIYQDHMDMQNGTGIGTFGRRQGGMFDKMFAPGRDNHGEMYNKEQGRPTTAFDARDRYKEARRREKQDRRNARGQPKFRSQTTNPYGQGVYSGNTQTQYHNQNQGRGRTQGGGMAYGQKRGDGGSPTMVRDWVGRIAGRNRTMTNGYGPQAGGGGDSGRRNGKLVSGGGGRKRWKDRLPKTGNGNGKGQLVYSTNRQGQRERPKARTGLGLLGISKAFGR